MRFFTVSNTSVRKQRCRESYLVKVLSLRFAAVPVVADRGQKAEGRLIKDWIAIGVTVARRLYRIPIPYEFRTVKKSL